MSCYDNRLLSRKFRFLCRTSFLSNAANAQRKGEAMTAPDRYQWRRDKDGLGIWEHRGKVAVGSVGYAPVDRRWDGVSMDKTLGAYSILACQKAMDEAGVTPDQIDGIICCEAISQAAAAAPRRGVGATAALRRAVRSGVGAHSGQRAVAQRADGTAQRPNAIAGGCRNYRRDP
jgi:hypothetical protein